MATIFGGDYDSLPELEIKTRVKLPGLDLWDKKTLGDSLDIIEKTLALTAKTMAVLVIASNGLPVNFGGIIQLGLLEAHMTQIERVLRSAHECGCNITQKSIIESWPESSPEEKAEIKQTILRAIENPKTTDEGKAKLREKFKEILEYVL